MSKETEKCDQRHIRKRVSESWYANPGKTDRLQKDRVVHGVNTAGRQNKIMTKHYAHPSISFCRTHIVGEELQHKSGHAAIDANEEVHAGEDHVGCAGDLEHEGGWVHERCDGPPGEAQKHMSTGCPLPSP